MKPFESAFYRVSAGAITPPTPGAITPPRDRCDNADADADADADAGPARLDLGRHRSIGAHDALHVRISAEANDEIGTEQLHRRSEGALVNMDAFLRISQVEPAKVIDRPCVHIIKPRSRTGWRLCS
ncbi:hypothetical protein [Caballeronia grimmiae]|uniref:hypothetical protein n=1 Tax=Caballeronia grimmiae TaxID=1071679 RepID=UPI0013625347|nr:hypothetical protein [Caballeronia grimmiae]